MTLDIPIRQSRLSISIIRMKLVSILALCAAVTATLFADEPAPAPTAAPATPAAETLATALTRATTEKRQLLLEFFSPLSPESKILSEQTLSQPQVKDIIADKFVVVRVEFEREPALAAAHHVTSAPTIVLLTSEGKEIGRSTGFQGASEFRRFLGDTGPDLPGFAKQRSTPLAPDANSAQRLERAQSLTSRGQFTAAVAEYAGILDGLGTSKDEVRFGTLVFGHLAALARNPSARASVATLAERWGKEAQGGHAEKLPRVIALYSGLGDAEHLLALYSQLPTEGHLREQMAQQAVPSLLQTKHYAEAVRLLDLETYMDHLFGSLEVHDHDGQAEKAATLARARRQQVAKTAVQCVEALLSVDQRRKAQRIAGRALDTLTDDTLRGKLADSAKQINGAEAQAFLQWLDQEYPPAKRS